MVYGGVSKKNFSFLKRNIVEFIGLLFYNEKEY